MVIVAILAFFASIVTMILSWVPSMKIDVDAVAPSGLYSVIEYVGAFVPTTQLGIILGLILAVYSLEFIWLLINWVASKIPTISG